MIKIPGYTQEKYMVMQNTVARRWGKNTIEVQLADVEINLVLKKVRFSQVPSTILVRKWVWG